MVREACGCKAKVIFDHSMPAGTPRKLCDTTLIRSLGWQPAISLRGGIAATVNEYREKQ